MAALPRRPSRHRPILSTITGRGRWRRAPLLAIGFLLAVPAVAAAAGDDTTVGQVLAACERGRAVGGQGLDAAICDWYLLPCACHGPADTVPSGSRWCIPPAEPPAATLAAIAAELRRAPDPTAPVEPVVAQILARLYPCPPMGP